MRPQNRFHLHIIANCNFALNDKRYTWRHDSVLSAMDNGLRAHIINHNESQRSRPKIPNINSTFVRPGEQRTKKKQQPNSLLDGASDWQLLTDFDHAKMVFPPEILSTTRRPDSVLWSMSAKKVILLELTCPAEEGFAEASTRKVTRYSELTDALQNAKWTPFHFAYEVGARGFVAKSTHHCLSKLGLPATAKKELTRSMSSISARCSFTIYLSRESLAWDRNRPLLS